MKNKKTNPVGVKKEKVKPSPILVITSSILGVAVIVLIILLSLLCNRAGTYALSLEGIYQESYYDLVDNINNAEIRMSKVLSTNDEEYSGELLAEVSKNAQNAQNNLSMLPISLNGIEENITFINQLGGYCETISKKIMKGNTLTAQEKETLQHLYDSLLVMKIGLNDISANMANGYSILKESLSNGKEYNNFTVRLRAIKTNDVEYPTMIYDGPFADSQIMKEVKALSKSTNIVDEGAAKEVLSEIFEISSADIELLGETTSNFQTYDFSFKGKNGNDIFAQVSKAEGRLITVAGYRDETEPNIGFEEAKTLAGNFIVKTGIDNVRCVWYDIIGGNAYFNFAPLKEGIILYPDLVKVKCSLTDGEIIGYESRSYYMNHIERALPEFVISQETAFKQIEDGFIVENVQKALAPIEYAEVLCYEFQCTHLNDIYFVYVNAITGDVDNVLKVIKTSDSNKIM